MKGHFLTIDQIENRIQMDLALLYAGYAAFPPSGSSDGAP